MTTFSEIVLRKVFLGIETFSPCFGVYGYLHIVAVKLISTRFATLVCCHNVIGAYFRKSFDVEMYYIAYYA